MKTMSNYFSAIQMRSDRWSALNEAANALARSPDEKTIQKLSPRIEELLQQLAPIESYWAFPGSSAFDHLRRNFEHRNFEDLAFNTRRITRALTSGAYRRRSIPLGRDEVDTEELEDEALLSPEARAMTKPYFEVLVVDDLNEHQERWLRSSMQSMRRSEDQFTYEPVIVPSFEDALIGILFNHNIQAVVVRPGLTLKSKNEISVLQRYLTLDGCR